MKKMARAVWVGMCETGLAQVEREPITGNRQPGNRDRYGKCQGGRPSAWKMIFVESKLWEWLISSFILLRRKDF